MLCGSRTEKTNRFSELMNGGRVRWEVATRSALHDKGVVPHLESPLPGWIGVGASPSP